MARVPKLKNARAARRDLTVSHRERLIDELRADPEFASEYLNAAAADGDPQVHLTALKTVVVASSTCVPAG